MTDQELSTDRTSLLQLAINAALDAGKAILDIYSCGFVEVEFKEDHSPLTLADMRAHDIIIAAVSASGLPVLSEESNHISYQERRHWKQFWLVDPLDGTKEFISRNGDFTVNIALVEAGSPSIGVVFNPAEDTLYFGSLTVGAFRVRKASSFGDLTAFFEASEKLPVKANEVYGIVASRSHLSPQTSEFINKLKKQIPSARIVSRGSALKFCLVAEGEADIYPRFSNTYEWDTAAGHAILSAIGGKVYEANNNEQGLRYNKENLLNPWFIAER